MAGSVVRGYNTVAALRAETPPTGDPGSYFFYCNETGQTYLWDYQSTSADDGVSVLAPNRPATSAGRYLAQTSEEALDVLAALAVAPSSVAINNQKLTSVATPTASTDGATKGYVDSLVLAAATISVATTTALAAYAVTGISDGTLAFITGQSSIWYLSTSAATQVTNRIVNSPTSGRQWVRFFLAGEYWVRTWTTSGVYINASTGNDNNDGSAAHPLATFAEWRFRLGPGPISIPPGSTMVVNVAAGTYAETVDLRGIYGSIHILGTETVAATGTLSSFTALNAGANTHTQVACTSFDFASHVKKSMVITSGAASGARAIIETSPGANQGQTSAFYTQASLLSSTITSNVALVGNETFDVRVPGVIVQGVIFDNTSGGVSTLTGPTQSLYAVISYVQFSVNMRFKARTLWNACKLDVKSDTTAMTAQLDGIAGMTFVGCIMGAVSFNEAVQGTFQACGMFGALILGFFNGSVCTLDGYTLISNSTVFGNSGQFAIGKVGVANTSASKHFFDNSGSPNGCYVRFASGAVLYGYCSGATSIGFNDPLRAVKFDNANAITPTFTTTGNNITYGVSARTWAQLAATPPYPDDNAIRAISITIGTSASYTSTQVLPANATILDVRGNITTPYSPASTLSVGTSGHVSDFVATTDWNIQLAQTNYKLQTTAPAASAAVLVTINGAPAAGVGVITVLYTIADT